MQPEPEAPPMPLLRDALLARFGDLPIADNSRNTVEENWSGCPTCRRRAIDLATLNAAGKSLCCAHFHRDHIFYYLKQLFKTYAYCPCWGNWINDAGTSLSAFRQKQLCSFCNEAEGAAKVAVGADKWFSFTPEEIASFVHADSAGTVTFDTFMARAIWNNNLGRLADHKMYAERFFDLARSGKIGPRGHQLRLRRSDEPNAVRELTCDGSYKNKTAARKAGLA